MQVGDILGATRTPEGILIRRVAGLEGASTILSVQEVLPGDTDWLAALAALPPDDGPAPEPDEPIERTRAQAIAGINRVAGEARRRWITVIPGQEMLYLEKRQEAQAYLSDPDPDITLYPLIAAEIGITAPSAWEVAQVYLGLAAIWRQIAAPLEAARLAGIAAVEVAPDAETVAAALAQTLSAITSICEGVPS